MRETMSVGELRALLADLPDEVPIAFSSGCCGCWLPWVTEIATTLSGATDVACGQVHHVGNLPQPEFERGSIDAILGYEGMALRVEATFYDEEYSAAGTRTREVLIPLRRGAA